MIELDHTKGASQKCIDIFVLCIFCLVNAIIHNAVPKGFSHYAEVGPDKFAFFAGRLVQPARYRSTVDLQPFRHQPRHRLLRGRAEPEGAEEGQQPLPVQFSFTIGYLLVKDGIMGVGLDKFALSAGRRPARRMGAVRSKDSQRQATEDAGTIQGLNVLRSIDGRLTGDAAKKLSATAYPFRKGVAWNSYTYLVKPGSAFAGDWVNAIIVMGAFMKSDYEKGFVPVEPWIKSCSSPGDNYISTKCGAYSGYSRCQKNESWAGCLTKCFPGKWNGGMNGKPKLQKGKPPSKPPTHWNTTFSMASPGPWTSKRSSA